MDAPMLLVWFVALMFPMSSLGAFSFDDINEGVFCDASSSPCSGTTNLLWNYLTDETVTVIEWYKQPDLLIARIFGVNSGAPFTVHPPYNAYPYNVTQYLSSDYTMYNAAIQITGLSASDEGVYSVNVTGVFQHSAILTMRVVPPLTEDDKPTVDCSTMTCTPPAAAVDVTTVWTSNGHTHRCTLKGGNTACSCGAIYADCTTVPWRRTYRRRTKN